MRLQDVLEMLVSESEEQFPKDQYAFKTYDSTSRRKRSFGGNGPANLNELLEYKMSGVNTFDINTEIRNLPCFELELIKLIPNVTRSGYTGSTPRSSNVSEPYIEYKHRLSDYKEDSKNEYDYIYNRISASTYDVQLL